MNQKKADEIPDEIRNDLQLYTGCMAGSSGIDEFEQLLVNSGFTTISIAPRDESKDFIKDWAPGRRVEEYVVSANIEAIKPHLSPGGGQY